MGGLREAHPCGRGLAAANTVGEATPGTLAAVCAEQGWAWGASWLVAGGVATMPAGASWSASSDLAQLDALARASSVEHGVGLAGRAWASGHPAWTPDLALDDDRPLALGARAAGLRAGFAFPIRHGDEIIGVLEFFARRGQLLDEALVTRMDAIGQQLFDLPRSDTATHEDARRLAMLGNARALFASSIDYDGAVALLPRLAASGLADWCVLEIMSAEGRVERVAVARSDEQWADDAGADDGLVADEAMLAAAFPRRELLTHVRSVGAPWLLRIPLSVRGRLLGILTLLTTRPGRSFGSADIALAHELALMGAVTIDNARLHHEAAHRRDNLLFVSHDLSHPLAVIDLNARLLEDIVRDDDGPLDVAEISRGLARIRRASSRVGSLIREVLDLARNQAGEPIRLDRRSVDLVALARQLADELGRDWADRTIELSTEVPRLLAYVDRGRIERAISNVLSNALKYSRGGGVVRVSVACRSERAVIEVADSGVGIPAAFFPHMFCPFRRASNVGGIAGAGIGLASAHQAIALHDGTITAASVEGQGAVFTIQLPL